MKRMLMVLALVIFTACRTTQMAEQCSSPYAMIGGECCPDANSNNICDGNEIEEIAPSEPETPAINCPQGYTLELNQDREYYCKPIT